MQEKFGVTKIGLIGSYARDEAIEDSDIAFAEIELKEKIVFYDLNSITELGRFVLTVNNNVIAGGMIVNE